MDLEQLFTLNWLITVCVLALGPDFTGKY